MEEAEVASHLDNIVAKAGTIDISFNAIGIPQQGMPGIPLTELSVESFALPIATYPWAHFVTARTAARHMIKQQSGVILMHTPEPARLGVPLTGGMSPAWAALEGLNRVFSAEWAPHGVRTVCLRTTGIEETATIDVVFGLHADAHGISRKQFASGSFEHVSHQARDHARRTRRCGRFRGLGSGRRCNGDRRQLNRRNHRRLICRRGKPVSRSHQVSAARHA